MYLQSQWLTLESIPLVGQQIFVRKNANLSTGWIAIDMTDDLHPEIKKMCEKATKILWLQVCWIDFLSTDISKPLAEQIWGIIEINATPGLRGHHFPFQGQPRNVAKAILDLAFQKGARK
jgi:cyanophycin synthetase